MAEANKNTEYFGDDTANYVKTLDEGMHNLGKLTAEGGNGKTRYMCSANAVVTMEVATENDMGKFFNTGDAYLYLNAGTLQQRIDLSELKESGTRTIPFEIGIQSESERQIDGYVEIINTSSDQTYLANKTLNIDVTFQDLDCDIGTSEVETNLRKNDKENKLTTNLVNGLYRYQGNSTIEMAAEQQMPNITQTVNDNYICLGSDCSETSNDMYRIIGVTEDGLMKVIKNTPIEQELQWWTDRQTDINWPQSLAYQYLNTDFYQTLPIELKNKIVETSWKYGDVDYLSTSPSADPRIKELKEMLEGDTEEPSKKELAKELAKLLSTETIELENNVANNAIGKVSLMSMTDYCSSFESNSDLNCMSTLVNNEILENPDFNEAGITWLTPSSGSMKEWTMSRIGVYFFGDSDYIYDAWEISFLGIIFVDGPLDTSQYSRPVFFLTSDIELTDDGEGTIENPFRVVGIE